MSQGVAPDGSPVEIYLALPAGDAPGIIDAAIPAGSTILELGSGPGRITHPLAALGHDILAVDNSAEMLGHIGNAETLLAEIFTLDLDRTFDAVVAGSHLINDPEPRRRLDLFEVCRRHLRHDGVALVERYAPGWVNSPQPSVGSVGEVEVSFVPMEVGPGTFRGEVTYRLGERSWTQEFEAAEVSDEMLAEEAALSGLVFVDWLDDRRTWALLKRDG